eukprot:CAMPEP_0170260578 /NCGR_PEP_ID=MMETSP0116_2-20130129/30166_1 /TAXON_ID=400756 /ORGANISM="Durinskia baltica, Strain CSIRO CS-38" /LENGTH=461 /DNA_ID=CAMNT_0010511635 /DNA_START=57 /DNA_END=1444 /DNA_ORIENTATION=+
MRLSVTTLAGRAIATLEADASWTKSDVCSHIPELSGPQQAWAHLLYGGAELVGEMTLAGLEVVEGGFLQLVFESGGRWEVLTACNREGLTRHWCAKGSECVQAFRGHGHWVLSAAVSADYSRLLTGSEDHTARLWCMETARCLLVLEDHIHWVCSVAFSPCGGRLLTSSYDWTMKLWSEVTGQCLQTYRGHNGWVYTAAFSLDAAWLVTCSQDRTARVWVTDTAESRTFEGHSHEVNSAAFSVDGDQIITASEDGTAKLWHAFTCECLTTFPGHEGPVKSVMFSPDGSQVLTASADRTARLWTVDGVCLHVLSGHNSSLKFARFSLDGMQLLTVAYDRVAKAWSSDQANAYGRDSGKQGGLSLQQTRHRVASPQDGHLRILPAMPVCAVGVGGNNRKGHHPNACDVRGVSVTPGTSGAWLTHRGLAHQIPVEPRRYQDGASAQQEQPYLSRAAAGTIATAL